LKDTAVAPRYARALFDAARGAKTAERTSDDLRRFAALLAADAALKRQLEHPLVSNTEKTKLLQKKLGKLTPMFERFIGLLLAKKRLGLVGAIASRLESLTDEADNVHKVHVRSAAPLSKEDLKVLEKSLAKAWGGTVSVIPAVDDTLIAGLVMRKGDRVWDRSLKGQLLDLRAKLLAGAAG